MNPKPPTTQTKRNRRITVAIGVLLSAFASVLQVNGATDCPSQEWRPLCNTTVIRSEPCWEVIKLRYNCYSNSKDMGFRDFVELEYTLDLDLHTSRTGLNPRLEECGTDELPCFQYSFMVECGRVYGYRLNKWTANRACSTLGCDLIDSNSQCWSRDAAAPYFRDDWLIQSRSKMQYVCLQCSDETNPNPTPPPN